MNLAKNPTDREQKDIVVKEYLNFKGKIAIVTGGRRGLGRTMILSLIERGAKVVAIAKSPEANNLMREIKELGGEGFYIQADLCKREERFGLIEKAVGCFGCVDMLVNNAGFLFKETAENCSLEHWDISRSGMLDAVFELSQQAIPFLKNQGGGKVINIVSVNAFRGAQNEFSYGVMKGAVACMTRCLSNNLAQYNINVNAIAPGVTRTALAGRSFEPEIMEKIIGAWAAGRLGEPEDIAGVMLFLASELSCYVHGQTIIVDGGFTNR